MNRSNTAELMPDEQLYVAILKNDLALSQIALSRGACQQHALGRIDVTPDKLRQYNVGGTNVALDNSGLYDAFIAIGIGGSVEILKQFVRKYFAQNQDNQTQSQDNQKSLLRCLEANLTAVKPDADTAPELAKFILKTWNIAHQDAGSRPVFNCSGEHLLHILIKRTKKMSPQAIDDLMTAIPLNGNKIADLLGVLNEKSESEGNHPWLMALAAAPNGVLPWLVKQYPVQAVDALANNLPRLDAKHQRAAIKTYIAVVSGLKPKPQLASASQVKITKALLLINDAGLLLSAHEAGLTTSVLGKRDEPQNTALAYYVQQCEAAVAPIQWHKDMIDTIFAMAKADGALNRCGQALREQITPRHDAILRKALLKHRVPLPAPTIKERLKFTGRYPGEAFASLVRRRNGRGGQ